MKVLSFHIKSETYSGVLNSSFDVKCNFYMRIFISGVGFSIGTINVYQWIANLFSFLVDKSHIVSYTYFNCL